jgi:hypothetical protein
MLLHPEAYSWIHWSDVHITLHYGLFAKHYGTMWNVCVLISEQYNRIWPCTQLHQRWVTANADGLRNVARTNKPFELTNSDICALEILLRVPLTLGHSVLKKNLS